MSAGVSTLAIHMSLLFYWELFLYTLVRMTLKVKVLVAQFGLTLWEPLDCNPPVPSQGILQARVLEWVAISTPGDLPHPGFKPGSPALQADSLPSEPPGKSQNGLTNVYIKLLLFSSKNLWRFKIAFRKAEKHKNPSSMQWVTRTCMIWQLVALCARVNSVPWSLRRWASLETGSLQM